MVSNPDAAGPGWQTIGGIERAWNRTEHHEALVKAYATQIDAVADAGFKNLICFSGNRAGLDDATGLKNCAEGLKKIPSAGRKARCHHLHGAAEQSREPQGLHVRQSPWGVEL
jgi:hydroxypyruvate isomerase